MRTMLKHIKKITSIQIILTGQILINDGSNQVQHFCCNIQLMLYQPLIALIFYLAIVEEVSAVGSAQLQLYNRYMISESQTATMSSSSFFSPVIQNYTTIFTYLIDPIQNIYYSSPQIQVDIKNYPSSNPQFYNMWYLIYLKSNGTTAIQTTIQGFFYTSYFYRFVFRFIIITTTNPFIGSYMTVYELTFNQATTSMMHSLPSSYVSGHNLKVHYFLWNLAIWADKNDIITANNQLAITISETVTSAIISTITSSPYFSNGINTFAIKYTMIAYDATAIAADYPRYTFESQSLNMTGSINFILGISTINKNTFFFRGLSSFNLSMSNSPNFQFYISTYNASNFTVLFMGNFQYKSYDQIAVAYFNCNSSLFYLNNTDNLCYDQCQAGQYFDYTNYTCLPCRFDCSTCYNAIECQTCNSTIRSLVGNYCIPINGFYESNMTVPYNCSSPCLACDISSTNCIACTSPTYLLINNTCLTCSAIFQGCLNCNSSVCINCLPTYQQLNETYCNIPCLDSNCLVCQNINNSFCLHCKTSDYHVNRFGLCQPQCGNQIRSITQECDDGNTNNRDGCAFDCSTEPNYICRNFTKFGVNYTGYCSYIAPIVFTVISMQKLQGSNTLQLILSISQYQQYFWSYTQTLDYYFRVNTSFINMKASFISYGSTTISKQEIKLIPSLRSKYPTGSLVLLTFQYLKPLHGQTIALTLDFSMASSPVINSIPPYSTSLIVIPNNNHYAQYYTSNTYRTQKLLELVYKMLSYISLVLLVISLFVGSKRIIVQNLIVLQLAWASLISAPSITPLLAALTSLSPSANLFNIFYGNPFLPFQDQLIDDRTRGTLQYSQFIYNFNVGAILILLPILIGAIALLIFKICKFQQQKAKKWKLIYQRALGQYTFVGLTFVACPLAFAASLEYKFGMAQIDSTFGLMSMVLPIILAIIFILYSLLRVKLPIIFGQYQSILLQKNNFSLAYQISILWVLLISGALLGILHSFSYVNAIILMFGLVLILIQQIKPIFKKELDRYRVQFNLAAIAIIQSIFIILNQKNSYEYDHESDVALMLPATIAIVLVLCTLINITYFVYEVIKKIKLMLVEKEMVMSDELKKDEKQYESKNSQKFHQLIQNSLNTPLQIIIKNKLNQSLNQEKKQQKNGSEEKGERGRLLEEIQQMDSGFDSVKKKTTNPKRIQSNYKYTIKSYNLDREYDQIDQL